MGWSLLTGPVPIALLVAALVAALFLVLRRGPRRWWTRIVPVAAGSGLVGAVGANWFVTQVWRPFPDPLPLQVLLWCGIAIAALVLLVANVAFGGWWRRGLSVLAVVLVLVGGMSEVNRTYGYGPSLAALTGQIPARTIPLPAPTDDVASATAVHRPGGPPARHGDSKGAVSSAVIPGVVSGFSARPAWIYFPPAYLARPRPLLPVLILLTGQPGTPRDWIESGNLVGTMNGFAAAHGGRAPVVVMPDVTGSRGANTLCIDSAHGHAATYATVDVVRWIRAHLQVDGDTAHWAIGGYSFGGTCALQLALGRPRLFPNVLDVSGQMGPTLGPVGYTVAAGFGGNRTAYDEAQPLTILRRAGHDPALGRAVAAMSGIFVVGARDRHHLAVQHILSAALKGAGARVAAWTVPGAHSWTVPAAALRQAMRVLAPRMGLP